LENLRGMFRIVPWDPSGYSTPGLEYLYIGIFVGAIGVVLVYASFNWASDIEEPKEKFGYLLSQIDQKRLKAEQAQRNGDYEVVAQILDEEVPKLEAQLEYVSDLSIHQVRDLINSPTTKHKIYLAYFGVLIGILICIWAAWLAGSFIFSL